MHTCRISLVDPLRYFVVSIVLKAHNENTLYNKCTEV